MSTYIINGGKKLEGEVVIAGSKNASLPIIAGAVLAKNTAIIHGCPDINDTKTMLKILEELGLEVKKEKDTVEIKTDNNMKNEIPKSLMKEMRSSVILVGALIAKNLEAKFYYPGGCEIGARPIDIHLNGLKKLGVDVSEQDGFVHCSARAGLIGSDITLDFPSVGATENLMLASCMARGTTYIRNCAREPEIIDLQNFLNKMGAKITSLGSNTLKIDGVESLDNIEYTVISDRIEAGTYLCAAAITGGKILLKNTIPEHLSAVIHKLLEMNCDVKIINNDILITAPNKIKSVDTIKTLPYPGFPTDMQPQFVSVLSVANGVSIVTENIFENRFKYINELIRMGAKINIEGRTAIIKGVDVLRGTTVDAKDLRGGAALILSALCAQNQTVISGGEYIDRGYENLEQKLKNLGANIKKA